MTEEIEVDSKRSAYADMVRYFLENTNLGYAAYFETWKASYVPSEGLGRINLGNAIFTRYPIIRAERIRQVDRTDQDLLAKTFTRHHGRDPVTHSQRGCGPRARPRVGVVVLLLTPNGVPFCSRSRTLPCQDNC